MPISEQAQKLLEKGRLNYGDPCYQPTWGSLKKSCEDIVQGGNRKNLALLVLEHYGIPSKGAPQTPWSSCCPLDILNQDPFACIKMSLSSALYDSGNYWEVYADEFGVATFVNVLSLGTPSSSKESRTLKNIQYCVPTVQTQNLVDMVIVRAADPPPFRQCGTWFDITDSAQNSLTSLTDLTTVFTPASFGGGGKPSPSAANSYGQFSSHAMKFVWGQVCSTTTRGQAYRREANSRFNSASLISSPTCDLGVFNQNGAIVYPDYDRKQGYKDGIVDMFEIGPHQSILFWLMDISFGIDPDPNKYAIQFTKSSEIPVSLGFAGGESEMGNYFPAECDFNLDPMMALIDPRSLGSDSSGGSCESPEASSKAKEKDKKPYIEWTDISMPSFYGYGKAYSNMNFTEINRWDVGYSLCLEHQSEHIYESTQSLMAKGCSLEYWKGVESKGNWPILSAAQADLGRQKDRRTFDLPHSTVWMEISSPLIEDGGQLRYALRSQAPSKATYCTMKYGTTEILGVGPQLNLCWGGDVRWFNALHTWMLNYVDRRFPGLTLDPAAARDISNAFSNAPIWDFKYPGFLLGMDDNLITIDDMWAKVTISRPGLVIQGKGRDVTPLVQNTHIRVMPVYTVDLPAPIAAYGNTGFTQIVNPDTDVWDNMYCTVEDKKGDTEKLQEASTGNVLELSFPFVFPDFAAVPRANETNPDNSGAFRKAYDVVGQKCFSVAQKVFQYLDGFRNEPNKSMSFICSPPKTQGEVPKLGETVTTPYGSRTINSINFQYTDSSSFSMTVDVGPVNISQASIGSMVSKRVKNEDVQGRVVSHSYGALYKIKVDGIGVISAYNIDKWPWQAGDLVNVQIYNNPVEI